MANIKAGTLYIPIRPDFTGFATEVKTKMVPVTKAIDTQLNKVGDSADRAFGPEVQQNLASTERGASKLGHTLSRAFTPKLNDDADHFQKTTSLLSRDFMNARRSGSAFVETMKMIKWPALIAGVQYLGQALVAVGAGFTALIGSMAPMVGLMGALPQLIGSGVIAMITLKLGLKDLGTAFSAAGKEGQAYKDALKGLAPAQRQMAETLHPFVLEMQKAAQKNLIPAVGDALKNLKPVMTVLPGILDKVSGAMAGVIDSMSRKFATPQWVDFIQFMGGSAAKLTRQAGKGLGFLADMFRYVTLAAQDMTQGATGGLLRWLEGVRDRVRTAFRTGQLKEFFDLALRQFHLIIKPVSNLFKALWNVLGVSRELGDAMWKSFGRTTQRWLEFTETVEGRNAIADWFQGAKRALHQLALLMKDLVGVFGDLSGGGGLAGIIKKIRTVFIPILKDLSTAASGDLIKNLLELGGAFLRLFATFATSTPVLEAYVRVLSLFANALTALIEKVPFLGNLLVILLATAKVGGLMTSLWKPAFDLVGLGIEKMALLAGAEKGAALSAQLLAIKMKLVTAATWLWNAAQKALSAVMSFSPWIIAIAAVAAAVYLIIRNWDTIKKWFIAFWNWIKPFFQKLWDAVKQPVMAVVRFAINAWQLLVAAFKMAWKVIVAVVKTAIAIITPILKGVWEIVKVGVALVVGYFKLWWAAVKIVMKAIWEVVKFTWNAIVAVVRAAIAVLKPIIKVIWEVVKVGIKLVIGYFKLWWAAVRVVVKAIWTAVKTVWKNVVALWRGFLKVMKPIWNAVKAGFKAVWQAIWTFLRPVVTFVIGAFRNVWNFLKTVWTAMKTGFKTAWEFVKGVFRTAAGVIHGVWNTIKGFAQTAWQNLKDVWGGMTGWFSNLWEGVKGAFSSAWNWIASNVLNPLINGINTVIRGLNKLPGPDISEIPTIAALAKGGVVTQPTLALVGEAGPEAVIPLDKLGLGGSGPVKLVITDSNLDLVMEGVVVEYQEHAARRRRMMR